MKWGLPWRHGGPLSCAVGETDVRDSQPIDRASAAALQVESQRHRQGAEIVASAGGRFAPVADTVDEIAQFEFEGQAVVVLEGADIVITLRPREVQAVASVDRVYSEGGAIEREAPVARPGKVRRRRDQAAGILERKISARRLHVEQC